MSDYPLLRTQTVCPRCEGPKPNGIVICWSCNRWLKNHYDGTWGPWEAKLERLEREEELRVTP